MKDPTVLQTDLRREGATTIRRHCLLKQDQIRQSSDADGNIDQRIGPVLKD